MPGWRSEGSCGAREISSGGNSAAKVWKEDCEDVEAIATGEPRFSDGAEMLHSQELFFAENDPFADAVCEPHGSGPGVASI